MSKQKRFKDLKKQLKEDRTLPLYHYRAKYDYKPVPGEGPLDASILFLGEAPGSNEAEKGRPFVGAAGSILDEMLKVAGFERGNVFITSILFDRPPGNRNPRKNEIEAYKPYLKELISIISPDMIVTLGNFAIKTLSKEYGFDDKFKSLGKSHGEIIKATVEGKDTEAFPTYHPAAILYNRSLEGLVKKDFKKLGKKAV